MARPLNFLHSLAEFMLEMLDENIYSIRLF